MLGDPKDIALCSLATFNLVRRVLSLCTCAVLAGVAGKTTAPNMWSVLAGDASSSILSHQIAIIRSKHTYLLSLTAHLPLSRTRRRMSRVKWLFISASSATRAFSWLKLATTAFTFKTLLRQYAKRALTPRSLNVKLGPRHKSHKGQAVW